MYISSRAASMRNLFISAINGGITLIILLIAPLGLAAVILNTLLVTAATYAVSSVADQVIAWLLPPSQAERISQTNSLQQSLRRSRNSSLEQRRR
jgi:hypothetical protein